MEQVLKWDFADIALPQDEAYLEEVRDILENEMIQSMCGFVQHGTTSCLAHCITVSYLSYRTCKRHGLDARAAARAGLMHDMFLYDWHSHKRPDGRLHGFAHPQTALENAEKEFDLNDLEREIILKHMWPLTIEPPQSKEAYVVLYHDKICSLRETFGRPVKVDELPQAVAEQ